jgi:hypothetical protein
MSPQDFASDIENAWEEAKADGKILKPGGVSE